VLSEPEPLDASTQAQIATWRYPGVLAVYGVTGPLDPAVTWLVRDDDGVVLGYVVTGHEARVAGQPADPMALDVGWGMDPDRIRRGLGRSFVAVAVAHAARQGVLEGRQRLRAAILDWNEASLRTAVSAGLRPVGEVRNDVGRFVIVERPVERGA
jgi:RimJ/RimL family protein N-acetyltransferase